MAIPVPVGDVLRGNLLARHRPGRDGADEPNPGKSGDLGTELQVDCDNNDANSEYLLHIV